MRVDLKKYLFLGKEEERAPFFKRAAELGVIQFITAHKTPTDLPADLLSAIKILRNFESDKQEEGDAELIVKQIHELKEREATLSEEVRSLKKEIAGVPLFAHFSNEDRQEIEKHLKLQFFFGEKGKERPELHHLGSDYFLSISKEPVRFDDLIEIHIDEPLEVLKSRLETKKADIFETTNKLKQLGKYSDCLQKALIKHFNHYQLQRAEQIPNQIMEGALFAVTGWVPANKVALLEKLGVYFEELPIEPDEALPTLLENEGVNLAGEELVHLYDTPSHNDVDPSLWLFGFFSLFYAMIIGDAGYGLLYLIAAYFLTPKLKTHHKILIYTLCTSCIVWGVLTNSYFGLHLFPQLSLLDWVVQKKAQFAGVISESYSDHILLETALLVGSIHICLSLARYWKRNLAALGWILAIMGGYLYVPHYLQATSMIQFLFGWQQAGSVGSFLFIIGLSMALGLSLLQNGWKGLLEITMLIQIFGDILSYLRLYALGLAGAIIAVTINEMAASLPYAAPVILFVGHGVNITLAVMSGVIHGLRLNFLEWYHYSFEGGGKRFSPLKTIK